MRLRPTIAPLLHEPLVPPVDRKRQWNNTSSLLLDEQLKAVPVQKVSPSPTAVHSYVKVSPGQTQPLFDAASINNIDQS